MHAHVRRSDQTPDAAARWIDGLPPALSAQADVLRRLLAAARRDERIRLLVVGCSLGRGAADEHSDIDALIAVTPEALVAYVAGSAELLERLGTVADCSRKRVEVVNGEPYELVWALFANDVQLELVIVGAENNARARPDWVVLHDPDGRVTEVRPHAYATAEQVREWAYEGWSLLILCEKYLARESLWEALETLHAARTRAWRLWAAARRVPDPQYGLTAVLDSVDPAPPPRIEATHGPLERLALAGAALACADLMNELWAQATETLSGTPAQIPPAGQAARRKIARLAVPSVKG